MPPHYFWAECKLGPLHKEGKVLETQTNENNMLEKMHICFKNVIVSEHDFKQVSYVTWYIFGEVTEQENRRNGGRR